MKKKNLFVILFIITSQLSIAQVLTPITDSIEMRDGKKLAADVYLPDTGKTYPVILIQTPYNRLYYRLGLPLKIGLDIKNSPYAVVIVDWRCFYGSSAACKALPDRGKDGYDVIDWISKQSWSNDKIGTWGPSALGKIQYQTAKEQHPNHTCAVPIVAGSQFNYQEYFPNGVLRTEYVDQLDALGYNMKNTLLQHPYYDAWWQYVEKANMYPDKIKIPMFLIGGWFDHNIDLMFDLFDTLVKASDPTVRDLHKFLVGPWSHNSVGKKQVGELEFPEAEGASDSFALLFFDYWLRGAKNGWPIQEKYIFKPIFSFYPEEKWNEYESLDKLFLAYNEVSLYLKPGCMEGGLSEYNNPEPNDSLKIVYDPKNPSPSIGGATLWADLLQGPVNLRNEVISRNDNIFLVNDFDWPRLMVIVGKPKLELYVSSKCFDTDFAVRLTRQELYGPLDSSINILSEGIYRMRFRDGFSVLDTQIIVPGKVYKITLEMPFTFAFFKPGDIPGIVITSSNYPRFDLNLNNGKELYNPGDTLTAENYIYFGKDYPSRLYFTGEFVIHSMHENLNQNLLVYPNPVNDHLIINTQKLVPPFDYSILDLQGKEMMYGEIKDTRIFSLDVSGLKPQVYLLKVKNPKQCSVSKFLKVN